ncbi:carbohydrate-binding protein [Halomonas sp. Bachu 37]|uniref:carbohydrate-binding protein n=1 Tax=Halomonas kashgarensis TaxID=3084920 RepID=UPI003216DFEE
MFSISWINATSQEFQRGLNNLQTITLDEVSDSAIRIIPKITGPLDPLQQTEEIELVIAYGNGQTQTLAKSSPPFIFNDLPDFASGSVQLLINALDSKGNVIEDASDTVDFELTETTSPPSEFEPIRIQAEDIENADGDGNFATLEGGITAVEGDPNGINADGNAYADFGAPSGETLTFSVDMPEAGEYELALSYALSRDNDAGERNRPLRLDVNDQLVDRMFDLRSTSAEGNDDSSDFTTFAERTVTVSLQAGSNTISFTSNGASGPNVDYLEIRKPAPGSQVIQGEDLILSPAAVLTPQGNDTNRPITSANIVDLDDTFRVGAEESSYLDWAYGNAEAYGEFTYQAPTAGTYSMTVTYASSSDRPLDLSLVAGGETTALGTFAFSTTTSPGYMPDDLSDLPSEVKVGTNRSGNPAASEWEGWTTETIEFTLAAGENLLRLGGRANGPNIDKIEMALVAAEPTTPTAIQLDNDGVLENQEGAAIGHLTVEDKDGDSHSFTVSDERFEVDANGLLRLKSETSLDFETETQVSVEVTATDPAGASVTETFVIAVGDVDDETTPPPVPVDPIRLQAEDFDAATAFTVENVSAADGGQSLRLPASTEGTASYALADKVAAGTYRVTVAYFDENDGESTAQLSIANAEGESFSGSWTFDDDADSGNGTQAQNLRTMTFENVVVGDSATLSLSANSTALEYARIDYIEFEPIDADDPVEPQPATVVAIANTSDMVESGDDGVTNLSFGLSASDDFSGDITLELTIDGVAETRTVSFTDGVAILTVAVPNDDEDNGTETVSVTLTDAQGDDFVIDPEAATATGSVSEDDEAPVEPVESIRLQAEDFDSASTFTVENITVADGGQGIRLPGNSEGTAGYNLDGKVAAGTYTVVVGYFDENDGESTARLSIGNAEGESFSGSWTFDDDADSGNGTQAQNLRTMTFEDVVVGDNATLSLSANSEALEYARFDYIEFVPTSGVEPEPEPDPVAIVLQAEDGELTILDNGSNATVTTVRDADNPEAGNSFSGLRPDYSGTGYVDFGDTAGDAVTFDVTVAVAGTYDLSIRYATNTDRPLDLSVNGSVTQLPFTTTDPDGSGPEAGFDHWAFETVTVELAAGSNMLSLAIPEGANTGPNIDRIEITETDSGPIEEDTSADEDGNLALMAADATLDPEEAATAGFTVTGIDDDIQTVEVSFDGGATRTPITPEANGNFTADLSAFTGAVTAIVYVTDTAGNQANASTTLSIDKMPVEEPFLFEIQGEALAIDDDEPTPDTVIRDASNPETNEAAGPGGLWDGYTGSGYLDMGNEAGDAAFFDVEVEEAGTYTLAVRYANGDGSGAGRPMNIIVGGESQGEMAFPITGVGNEGWLSWGKATIEVELEAGSNTIRLENAGNAGPNIDSLSVSRGIVEEPEEPPFVEPGERFSVKINFEPEGFATPDGYVADTGLAFGDRSVEIGGKSYQYGWVTEASIADGTDNGTIPLAIADLTSVAVNDRTDDIAGLDPRQGTYAHFDQPAANYVRAGWEMELDDGFYEVTIAIGNTSGPYDSVNAINAEGELFNDPFTPFRPDDFPEDNNPGDDTDGFRSDLVTRVVHVTDGRLTLDSIGLGDNTEIQYIEIQSLPDLSPDDDRKAPEDYAFFNDPRAIAGVGASVSRVELDPEDGSVPVNVDPGSDIFVGISVVDGRGGALLESLDDGSVRLFETVSGEEVSLNVNTTGGFDSLTISPNSMLKEHTSYTLVIDGFQDRGENDNPDAPTRMFQKFTNTFVTGEAQEVVPREVAFSHTVELNGAEDNAFQFTSLEISPDGSKMYITNMMGQIKRYDIDPQTGALSNEQVLSLDIFQGDSAGTRGIIGLTFDPTDPNVLWVTDNYPIPLTGRDNGVPDFSGRILKITLDAGEEFSATAEPYITGLPRSNGDHVTNSLEFRANPAYDAATNPDVPTHLLYLIQGSNTAMGAPDSAWGNRPERLLNAAVMEIDPTRDAPAGGFDVTTEPLPEDGLNRRYTDDDGVDFKADPIAMGNDRFLVFAPNGTATVENSNGDTIESYYDPFAEDAVVKIFATGIRNAYDLVWHSDGKLYIPTNGSAAGGNVPDDPSTPENEYQSNVEKQDDYLFTVEKGGYYGHPNPLRDEFILNGGNPTSGSDPHQVNKYPVGQQPDPNYDMDGVYSLGENRSPNGVTEYTSGVFGGNLQGSVLFTEYSGGDDIRSITFDANGNITGDEVLRDVNGNVITYIDPLDIIENPATGQLYLLTLNRNNGQSQIVRLDPAPGGELPDPVDPQEPSDGLASLLIIQAEDNTPDDGTSVSIAQVNGAEIQIRTTDNPEANQPTGVRPGAYGLDGNNNDDDGVLGGYADFGSTNADFLTFNFELSGADAGESVLRVRYANGATSDRPLEVFVNNVSVGTFAFSPPTSVTGDDAWNEWLTLDIPAELVSGLNTVRFQSVANTGPNIDQLEILQEPADATPGYIDYEAEDAQLDGPVVISADQDDHNASGEGFVDFTGNSDQSITWTVEVAEAGTYEVGFRYALAATKADRPMAVAINGIAFGILNFPGQSNAAEDNWFFQSTSVTLGAGSNTITVTAPDANGPNIDLLRVSDTPLDSFEPSYADIDGSGRIELESGDSARAVNERTADFYFTVNEDGAYKLDLAANSGSPNGGQLTLLLNGQQIDKMAFPGVGDAGEQSAYVELQAGVSYNLRVISTADGANEIDYLDVSSAPGDPDADIAIQSNDAAYFSDRLHFSYLENNSASSPNRDYKEDATVTISNTGTNELTFIDVDLDGPFILADPGIFNGLTLAAGESIAVEVLFDRPAYIPPTNDAGDGVFEGKLRLVTNDADTPVAEVHLAGFWQARDEGGWEPNVNEVWEVFGFGNVIDGLSTRRGGENSVLNDFDLYRPINDDEVMSRYWKIAEGFESAKITQLAAYHGSGGATLGIHNPGNKGQDITLSNHASDNNQSLLPIKSNGQFATATFTRDQIPDGWIGNDIFGIEVANLSTDPSLNPTGGGTVPEDAAGIERGYTVRMFQALDASGNVIPNTYLGIMDYTGINYDYNDNMFVIEGISPVSGGEISITNLDGVPSNERLVMSRIEDPASDSQVFHDESTFTITNDGFANLEISSLEIADPTLFEIVGATENLIIPPGGTLNVTVRFIAEDFDDATLYETSLLINSNDANQGQKVIQLAGLAQGESEKGREPLVQEIIDAFGFSTNVAESEMNKGGLVEANGDEILSPYFQRADGGSPIKITQLAAYHTQGDVARLYIHDVDSRDIDEVIAHDEQDGQTLLPRALDSGDQLAMATLDRDDPFGFFADITGRQGYISWSDPDANLYEDTVDEIGSPGTNLNWDENDGHLIRVYVAKDGAGNVIPHTYVVIQDYAGVNYDYNDNIFLVENVKPYDPTGVEDADGNGRVDLYDDDDGDGVPNFLDGDMPDVPDEPVVQTPYNADETPWLVDDDGLTLVAAHYDAGGPGVAYVDSSENQEGSNYRGEGVDIVGNGTAIGWVVNGEWVEYTINVAQAGSYELSFLSSMGSTNGSSRSITASFAQGDSVYETAAAVAVDYSGSWTNFEQTESVQVDLQAGEQVVRLTFNGGSQDLASFTLSPVAPSNTAPVVGSGLVDLEATQDESFSYTIPTDAFSDADGDSLSYTASGLPAGLAISAAGVISGTPTAAGSFDILVTASDGSASVESGFTLNVGEAPDDDDGQTPFNASKTPWLVGDDGLTLEAAHYDAGGPGVAYNDGSESQKGSNYRGEGVDIVGDGDAIGWIEDGEWVEYTINVEQAGTYGLSFVTSTPHNGRSITASVEQNGTFYEQSSPLPVPNSGAWGNYVQTQALALDLQAGEQVVRLTFNGGSMDLQSLSLAREEVVENPQQPFTENGAPWLIDDAGLLIDAVDYDQGGAGIAYSDGSEVQLGNPDVRGEGVDILGDGEAIGWIEDGEWVEYTVDVAEAGAHTFSFIASTPHNGRSITVAAEQDGVFYEESAPVSITNSGAWGNYVQSSEVTLDLQEGEQVVRLTFNGGSMDLQSLMIQPQQNAFQSFTSFSQPSLDIAPEENSVAVGYALGAMGVQESVFTEQLV